MTEKERLLPDEGNIEKSRDLETLSEKLDFLRTRFVDKTETLKTPQNVAEEGDEVADEEITEFLYAGELTEGVVGQIKASLSVDLTQEPSYRLTGEFEYDVYEVPGSEENLYIVKREVDEGFEILQYEYALLEMFTEIQGLEREEV